MNQNMNNFFKISEIDAIRGINTPHESDLKDLGNDRISLIRNLTEKDLSFISRNINGNLIRMDLGEDWAISKEFFKGVNVIILYQYYGDEFGDDLEDEIMFRFSGENVRLVTGEDLCHFSEIMLNLIELVIKKTTNPQIYTGTPSHMLDTALKERTEPFFMIDENHYQKIAEFTNSTYYKEEIFKFEYNPFPNFTIILKSSQNSLLTFQIHGELSKKLSVYDSERLVMMMVNHILRYIKLNLVGKVPKICDKMFSGYYKGNFPEKFKE